MCSFKPGDVVRYSGSGEAIIESIEGDKLTLTAWRGGPNGGWLMAHGMLTASGCRPHPEADRVLAEFTAARLLGEIDGDKP